MPSLSPRRRHSVSLPETAPTGPPQRIDQPTTPTPNPSKSTITVTHATNGTLISGSLGTFRSRAAIWGPFPWVATQNPVEQIGTFPLPESQLDRFMMRLSMGYPSAQAEKQLYFQGDRRQTLPQLQAVCNAEILAGWMQEVAAVKVSQAAADYVFRLVEATRQPGRFVLGLSPRAGLAVVAAAKAWAFMQGRGHVLPDDVKAVWVPVANHRVQAVQQQQNSEMLLKDLLDHVAIA